jgi:hypothetical protein
MGSEGYIFFENGSIWQWTEDGNETKRANWFTIINQNKFGQIGFGQPPTEVRRDSRKIIDLNGKLVLPGLHDSHIHIYSLGECSSKLDLSGSNSITELKQMLKNYSTEHSDLSWIIGRGWDQDKLGSYPTRYDLDEIVADRPVVLWRACWHVAVINTQAMHLAGMDLNQTSWTTSGGVVDLGQDGKPNGILRESACKLIKPLIFETSDEIRLKYLSCGLQQCLQYGLTAVQTNDRKCWKLYQRLQREGNLPIRVYLTPNQDEIGSEDIPKPGTKDGLLSCDRVKLFADGSLGAETAAVRLPYRGTENKGVLIESDEDMLRKISEAEKAGYRVEIHAIGDRGAAQVLNSLRTAKVAPERRPILTHCQILGPDLIDQMRELGVIADIQPTFVITDAAFAKKRLDESVLPYSYCWKRLMESGIVCAGGSDAPVEICNPLQGIHDAIFRDCLAPEQALNFEQTLLMYTKNGAFTAMDENQLGKIKENFKADFVILKEDVTKDLSKFTRSDLVESVWVDGIERFNSTACSTLPPKTDIRGPCDC